MSAGRSTSCIPWQDRRGRLLVDAIQRSKESERGAIRFDIPASELKNVLYAYPTSASDIPFMV